MQDAQRWAVMLSAYHYDIEYKRSTENVCADAMSRLPMLNYSKAPLTAEEAPEDQLESTKCEVYDYG